MEYVYRTKGTCSSEIRFNLQDGIVSNVSFKGGCNGNLQAISNLVDGCTVDAIVEKCNGVQCGFRGTSCADQLSLAVQEAYDKSKE